MASRTAAGVALGCVAALLEPTNCLVALLRGTPPAARYEVQQECGPVVNSNLVQVTSVRYPGAGSNQSRIKPYAESYMDGYHAVECAKDYLYEHGDKHGDNKLSYKPAKVADVSIVHYADHTPSTEKKAMTHEVCFGFCRTVQNMSFFGIVNGRDCYCAPFFQIEASDNSDCDSPCDGNKATMCGGKSKSSIFAMHNCSDDWLVKVQEIGEQGDDFHRKNLATLEKMDSVAEEMNKTAVELKALFSSDGNPGAAGLAHIAQGHATKMTRMVEAVKKLSETFNATVTGVGPDQNVDYKVKEATLKNCSTKLASMEDEGKNAMELAKSSITPNNEEHAVNASKKYLPAMDFVDKAFVDAPSTCTGAPVGNPMGNATKDGCARACDLEVTSCVGFQVLFPKDAQEGSVGLCFLMSKMETIQYYQADCQSPTRCYVKGTGPPLKPDPQGKCETCLKEALRADRCPFTP